MFAREGCESQVKAPKAGREPEHQPSFPIYPLPCGHLACVLLGVRGGDLKSVTPQQKRSAAVEIAIDACGQNADGL